MEFSVVKNVIEEECKKLKLKSSDIFLEISEKPIHSGSVAQVHRAKMRVRQLETGKVVEKWVAIKVWQAGLHREIGSRHGAIQRPRGEGLGPRFFSAIFGSWADEGDFRKEGKSITDGAVYMNAEDKVSTVRLAFPQEVPATESMLVMDLIKGGISLGDTESEDLAEEKLAALGRQYIVWLREAVLGGGFFTPIPMAATCKCSNLARLYF